MQRLCKKRLDQDINSITTGRGNRDSVDAAGKILVVLNVKVPFERLDLPPASSNNTPSTDRDRFRATPAL